MVHHKGDEGCREGGYLNRCTKAGESVWVYGGMFLTINSSTGLKYPASLAKGINF